jgi:starch phosphorylase
MPQHSDPVTLIQEDEDIAQIMQLSQSGHFNQGEPDIFKNIIHSHTSPHDPWLVIADLRSFIEAQQRAAAAYQDPQRWTLMSIVNSASSGRFSTDRTIEEYNAEIWKLAKVPALPVA